MPETVVVTSMTSQFKIGENISIRKRRFLECQDVCLLLVCLGARVKGNGEEKVFNFKTISGTYNALGIYWELSTQSEIDGNNAFNRGT